MTALKASFFTVVGCMDGRVQEPMAKFGREKFQAEFPDTITEAGVVGLIANDPSQEFLDGLKLKLLVSVDTHHSKGILVNGHQKCAGNKVDDVRHKEDVRKSVSVVRRLIEKKVDVVGVFVTEEESKWEVNELDA